MQFYYGGTEMTKEEMTDLILAAKEAKGFTWETIAGKMDMGEVWVASACYGMNSMPEDAAKSLCEVLDLDEGVCAALQEFPNKAWEKIIPQDPVMYRVLRDRRRLRLHDQADHRREVRRRHHECDRLFHGHRQGREPERGTAS